MSRRHSPRTNMNEPQRWSDLFDWFDRAIEASDEDRAAVLDEARAEDPNMARQLVEMLAAHFGEAGVLDRPVRDLDAEAWIIEQQGRTLGPYVIGEPLGEGGMGVVFAARQEEPIRRRVAVKLIKQGMDTREVLKRFHREQEALARMEHPGIARVLDAGTTPEGTPYFVMEHVDGVALDDFCNATEATVERRLELMIEVCRAVQHAHQKGIIHRDLKPSNVLVRTHGDVATPVVIDFGIAKAVDTPDAHVTGAGRFIGTPDYMSPEQRRGGADVDTRADIYGLGALLFALLSGARPGAGTDDTTAENDGFTGPGLRPSAAFARLEAAEAGSVASSRSTTQRALLPRLRGELDWITARATAPDPDDRYAAASDLADDLRAHLDGLPVAAGPPSALYRVRKLVARHRVAAVSVAIALAALAAFAGGILLQSRQVRQAYVEAEAARAEAEAQLARTQRVSDLLVELFEGADPTALIGAGTATVETLEHGIDRMRIQLAGEEEIQADLLARISEVFANLGLYDRAEELLLEALELRAADVDRDRVEDVPLWLDLSTVRSRNARYAEGRAAAQEALDLLDDAPQTDAIHRGRALLRLGSVHLYAGEYLEAEPHYREALQIITTELPDADIEVGEAHNDLGLVLGRLGEYDESERLLRIAVANAEALTPEHETSLATRLMNLSLTLRRQGNFDEALTTSARATEIRTRIFGEDHPETAITLENRAQILNAAGRAEEAVPMLEEVVAIRLAGRPDDPRLATSYSNLGVALRALRRYDEAVAAYLEGLAIRERTGTAEGTNAAALIHNLSVALSQQGRHADALEYSRRAVALFRSNYGDDNVMVSIGLMRLGRIECVLGDMDASSASFLEAKRIQDTSLAEGHWRTAVRQLSWGQCLYEAGDYGAAEPELLAGVATAEAALGPDHANTTRGKALLVRLYEAMGEPERADPYRSEEPG